MYQQSHLKYIVNNKMEKGDTLCGEGVGIRQNCPKGETRFEIIDGSAGLAINFLFFAFFISRSLA